MHIILGGKKNIHFKKTRCHIVPFSRYTALSIFSSCLRQEASALGPCPMEQRESDLAVVCRLAHEHLSEGATRNDILRCGSKVFWVVVFYLWLFILVVLVVMRVLIRTNSGKSIICLCLCLCLFFGCCNYMISHCISMFLSWFST